MNRQRHLHALTQRTTTRQRNLSAHTAMYHERHLSAIAQIAALLASASTNATPETDASGGDTRDAQVYNMCRHIQAGNESDYRVDDNLYSIYNQAARKHVIYVGGKKVASICRYQFSGDVSIRSRVWAVNDRVAELDAIHRYFSDYREEELNDLRERCEFLGSGSAPSVYHL